MGKTHRFCLDKRLGGGGGGEPVGGLLLDVYVRMEIIDFLLPRIKQKMSENVIITLDCVQPSLPFHDKIPWIMLLPRPISWIRRSRPRSERIILKVDVMDKINK